MRAGCCAPMCGPRGVGGQLPALEPVWDELKSCARELPVQPLCVWAVVKGGCKVTPATGNSRITCLRLFVSSTSHCLLHVDAGGLQTPKQSLFLSDLIVNVLTTHGNVESS